MNPALVLKSDNPIYRARLLRHRIGITLSVAAMLTGLMFLIWILTVLVINGFGAIDMDFFTKTTPAPGSAGGGLLNPIVGSLMMVGTATLISTPIGISPVSTSLNTARKAVLHKPPVLSPMSCCLHLRS